MLSLFTLLVLVSIITSAVAYPIPGRTPNLDQCPPSSTDTRTIWSIVWSSLATLFACIWAAVHPNIPAFRDGTPEKLKQRAKLLLVAVVAPEIVIMFAMRQWVCARDVMQRTLARGEEFAL
jgi:hypothetical protein